MFLRIVPAFVTNIYTIAFSCHRQWSTG